MELKAFHDELEVSKNRFLLDAFVNTLPDSAQKRYIWDKEPQGLEDAAKAALSY